MRRTISCLTLKCHVFHKVILWWYFDIWIGKAWDRDKTETGAVSDKLVNNNKCNRQPFNCSTSKNLSSFSTRLWMLARGEGICSNSFIFPMRGHIILIRWKLWMRKSGPKMNQTYEESYTQFISVLFSLMKVLKSNKRRKLAETCTLHSPNWNPNFISPQFIYRYLDIYTIPIKRTLGKTRKCFPASAKILSFVWSFCMNIYILAFPPF